MVILNDLIQHQMKTKILVALIALAVFACSRHGHEEKAVLHQIHEGEKNYTGVSVSSEPLTEGVKKHEVQLDGHSFLIKERESDITSFPCSDCHNKPVAKLQTPDEKKAHWNLKLNHADKDVMNCMTCHTDNDMNALHTGTGSSLRFNDSYKLCGQCHSPQYKEWKGGAHGKRVASWAPPRVSNTCTNCHDPHSPSFESRWPSRYNTFNVDK